MLEREIDDMMKQGASDAIKERIYRLQRDMDYVWEGTQANGHFIKLGAAIAKVENKLRDMRELLAALRRLDSRHK